MLPIIPGVIPFGLVMGTVASNAHLSLVQTSAMNIFVFAGASQLAAVDLMVQNAPSFIVIATGVIINLRFLLYSAALSETFHNESVLAKSMGAYFITDQSYSVLAVNESRLKTIPAKIKFYFGASTIMIFAWQCSVLLGLLFGNFAPSSLSLDYAVPLSFVALVMPTFKNKSFVYVALLSSVLSLILKPLPFNLGLLVSGLIAIVFGAYLSRKKGSFQ